MKPVRATSNSDCDMFCGLTEKQATSYCGTD